MTPQPSDQTIPVRFERGLTGNNGHVPFVKPSTVIDLTDAAVVDLEDERAPIVRPSPVRDLHAADLGRSSDDVEPSVHRWQRVVKRGMDVVGAIVLLVVTSPLLLVAAFAVLLTSSGRPIFVCERIGRDGRPFRMYKIRSMVEGADVLRSQYERANERSGPIFKIRRDPRMTPVGRVLRKLSIDELPQLVNVLRGEMSLVGPRPPLPAEYARYEPREKQRLRMTPGMTGIWQVSGRSEVDFDEWVEMDLEYITRWSLRLDLKLLVLTIPAVLSGRGAY